VVCNEKELGDPGYAALVDAVIFSQNPEQRNALGQILRSSIPSLLNSGARVYVRIARDMNETSRARDLVINALIAQNVPLANISPQERERIPKSYREREGGLLTPYAYIFDSDVNWIDIAHIVCDHPAGDAPSQVLQIDGLVIKQFSESQMQECQTLLRRSFFDSRMVHLKPMVDGLSGAPVFKAHVSLRDGLAGEWPYLHFVKIGPRKKIVDEYDRYIGRALDYVPFHLGPRIRLDRCNLGSSLGILVGDFVEGAEPIRDSAPRGSAGHAISNLFDKTLGPWRKQAKIERVRSLEQFLDEKWLGEDDLEIYLSPERAAIVSMLGGDPSVATARGIFGKMQHRPVLCSPTHGDLHATNVLVRGGDAIIIDFEKMKDQFPVLYDPASLESGLLVESLASDSRSEVSPAQLLAAVSPLYVLNVLDGCVSPCHAADPISWFYDCLAQIRTLSRHALPIDQYHHYALVLAVCLIRKGCNPEKFDQPHENLRAIAFVLGQKILFDLNERLETKGAMATPQRASSQGSE
jgi:hypothetical protein